MKKAKGRRESYSSLSLLEQCPYKYYLKYICGYYPQTKTLPLALGNLCHTALEMVANEKSTGNALKEIQEGLKSIQNEFFEDWIVTGKNSKMTFGKKMDIFYKKLDEFCRYVNKTKDKEWEIVGVEVPFQFKYRGVTIVGKIDKLEKNQNGDYRVTDYKTSDKPYDDKYLNTPLQMFIYGLACENLFGKLPKEYIYDFVLIDQNQTAFTKGWYNRGKKKLDKIIEKREEMYSIMEFVPRQTPLCYYCDYREDSCTTDINTKDKCEYYSLWTPNRKTFDIVKEYPSYKNQSIGFEW